LYFLQPFVPSFILLIIFTKITGNKKPENIYQKNVGVGDTDFQEKRKHYFFRTRRLFDGKECI